MGKGLERIGVRVLKFFCKKMKDKILFVLAQI